MADGHSTAEVEFAKCPAFKGKIVGHINYELRLGDKAFGNEVVTATMTPTGVSIRHECKDRRPVPQQRPVGRSLV